MALCKRARMESMKFALRFALAAPLLIGLTGCFSFFGGGSDDVAPHLRQLPGSTQALLAIKGMTQESPIFIRIFKEESELEVWKLKNNRFEHFRTYSICAWSGTLGPKVVQGDKQAPEGFYTVSAGAMNPKSQFYLSFNLGYPNAHDRSNNYTGSALMVHGKCKSAGCYAMTDAYIEEIYILAREAFNGGQTRFHVHAFPFRMTEANMARHRDNPWFGFWTRLKEGYDAFEVARKPPIVKTCGKQYLVNVQFTGQSDPSPEEPCPLYAKIDPNQVPGFDGMPPTMLASLKKQDQMTAATTAAAQPSPTISTASLLPSVFTGRTAPPAPVASTATMSASPVVTKSPVTSQTASLIPAPAQVKPAALPVALRPAPAPAAPAPASPAVTPPLAITPPAAPKPDVVAMPALPSITAPPVASIGDVPTKDVDPTALQKPNRSGKGGKLVSGPASPEVTTGGASPTVGFGFDGRAQ